jgi:outer membrane protein assembly factor BamA
MPGTRFSLLILALCVCAAVPRPAGAGEARLTADRIRVFGNEKIKPYVLLRALPFRQGEAFDEEDLEAAREHIRSIPGVDFSDIRVAYVPKDSAVVITILITEKPTIHGHLLTSRGYENKLSFGLKALDDNFRGRGEKLHFAGLFRGNTLIEAGWENPWIGRDLHLGIGFKVSYKRYKYVYDDVGAGFNGASIERVTVELGFSHPLGSDQRITLANIFETVRSPVAGVTLLDDRDSYYEAALTFERDSRKSKAFPFDSDLIRARIVYVGPGDPDYEIVEGTLDARKYVSMIGRNVLAAQLTGTWRDGEKIPLYRREHVGGSNTLRGYDYGTFHGVNSLIGTIEYRVPVNFCKAEPVEDVLLGLAVQFFGEAGAAWEKGETLREEDFHGSFGLGVSLLTKNAAGIRFDYAWNRRSQGRWEIDAGLKF